MVDICRFQEILTDLCDELPESFFKELHKGVIVSEEAKPSPYSIADDLWILGEYSRSRYGNQVIMYYGSFMRLFFWMDEDELRKKDAGCAET